jgi:predicted Zn-dependent peptidase
MRGILATTPFTLASLILGLSPAVALAETTAPPDLPAERLQLPNGLTVLLAPDASSRLVSVQVTYAAGAADDPDGLRGLAHLVEHLVAERTEHVEDALGALESAGACRMNAVTSLDRTSYFESVPPEHLETVMWVESDRMAFGAGAVTPQRVDAARAAIANEARDRELDGPLGLVDFFTSRELFPIWHPYAPGPDPTPDLGGARAEDVKAFLRTWYAPGNAVLAVAGFFDRDAVVRIVTRYFGSIPERATPERPPLAEWPAAALDLEVKAAVPYSQVRLAWPTPAFATRDDLALDVVGVLLSDRLSARLVGAGLVMGEGAREHSMGRGSVFVVRAGLEPGADPRAVTQAIQDEIDGIARLPASAEVAGAHVRIERTISARMETTWGRAGLLSELTLTRERFGASFTWGRDLHEGVTADDVAHAASTWLARSRRIATVVLPNPLAPWRGMLVSREIP